MTDSRNDPTCSTHRTTAGPAGRLLYAPLLAPVLVVAAALGLRAVGAGAGVDSAPGVPDGPGPDRAVAVTFDDVPGVHTTVRDCDVAGLRRLGDRLLDELERQAVPAMALVNAGNICDERRDSLPGLLRRWTDGGHDLGNHTFSHRDLNQVDLAWYLADMERSQLWIDRAAPEAQRWFRPPMLHTGDTPEKHHGLYRALAERRYRMAPVTVDNQEWIFADVYARALAAGDTAVARKVAMSYVAFMDSVFAFFERRSREVLGREIPQVLLLHHNELNADHFDALAAMMRSRGYRFVSVAEALSDSVYERPDPYIGPRGLSWIHRWGLAEGMDVVEEPREPAWLVELRREYRGRGTE